MPFTVNVGPYQGGGYLAAGLSNLGQGIGQGLATASELRRQQQVDQETSDTIFEQYLKSQNLDKEQADAQRNQYYALGPYERKGRAAGIAANWLQDYRAQQIKSMQNEMAFRNFQIEAAKTAQAMAGQPVTIDLPGAPGVTDRVPTDQNTLPVPYAQAGELLPQATSVRKLPVGFYDVKGDLHMLPGELFRATQAEAPTGPPVITTQRDPESGEILGHSLQYPNTKVSRFIPKLPEGVQTDAETGTHFTYTQGGGIKTFTDRQEMLLQDRMDQAAKKAAAAQAPAAPTGYIGNVVNAIAGRRPAPAAAAAPSATPAPAAAPAGKVKMQKPDGTVGYVPSDYVNQALAPPNNYKLVP